MSLPFALAAAVLYAYAAWRARRGQNAIASDAVLVAILAQGVALSVEVIHAESLTIGIAEALSVLAWLSALMLWVFCLREPLQMLGLVLYPICAVLVLGPALFHDTGTAIPLADWKIGIHILFSLLSAGLLTLASLQALSTAALDRILHRPENLAAANRLPPLLTMERLLFQMIVVGFVLLSCTLLTGLLFVHDLFGQHLAHKTVLSAFAWLIFGVLIWGRFRHGWRGRRALRWALAGYGALVLAYFGSKLVLELVLGKHWT